MVKYAFLASMLLIMNFVFARAGDAFLSFVGKKLHVHVSYKNHSGFLSCFISRFIELDEPVFILKDFGLDLGCKKAYIEPEFDKLLTEKAIILNCTLKDVSLLRAKGEGELSALFDKISSIVYDTVYITLVVYNDRVRFPLYEAHSEHVKLCASGSMTEKGEANLNLKAFFSPEIAAGLPEELKAFLTEEAKGWVSYRLNIESGKALPFLKLESDRFSLNFENVKVK